MTTATFDLPNSSSFIQGLVRSIASEQPQSAGGTTFAGPSPFEIPESIRLTLEAPDELVFQFDYTDNEKPEDQERRAVPDGSITALLADKTKKILRLRIHREIEELFESTVSLDVNFANPPNRAVVSTRTLNSFRRSAAVIEEILHSIPPDIRQALVQSAQKLKR
jgi:hypothetical protein